MADNHIKVFDLWRESTQKFDYFVAGLIGALLAFIGQSFASDKLGINPSSLELLALLLLVFAFLCAFKRIESNNETLRLTYQRDRSDDQMIELRNAKDSGQLARDVKTGEVLSQEGVAELMNNYAAKSQIAESHLKSFSTKAYYYYHFRNYTLILGFLLLLAARVFKAYYCAP
jgi:hypothetical protein